MAGAAGRTPTSNSTPHPAAARVAATRWEANARGADVGERRPVRNSAGNRASVAVTGALNQLAFALHLDGRPRHLNAPRLARCRATRRRLTPEVRKRGGDARNEAEQGVARGGGGGGPGVGARQCRAGGGAGGEPDVLGGGGGGRVRRRRPRRRRGGTAGDAVPSSYAASRRRYRDRDDVRVRSALRQGAAGRPARRHAHRARSGQAGTRVFDGSGALVASLDDSEIARSPANTRPASSSRIATCASGRPR